MKRTAIALVLAAFAAAAVRVVLEGRAALDAADHAPDKRTAIADYEIAARWYLPGAPHVGEAYSQLRALTADRDVALLAWRAIRSAALASRWLVTPHADDLADANAAIAKLEAADPETGVGGTAAWHDSRLERSGRPGQAGAAVAIAGIALWIGAAIALAWRRPARRSAIVLAIGVVLWAAGLYNA